MDVGGLLGRQMVVGGSNRGKRWGGYHKRLILGRWKAKLLHRPDIVGARSLRGHRMDEVEFYAKEAGVPQISPCYMAYHFSAIAVFAKPTGHHFYQHCALSRLFTILPILPLWRNCSFADPTCFSPFCKL